MSEDCRLIALVVIESKQWTTIVVSGMVQDFLRFLRPTSPLEDTPPRLRPKSRTSQANSERSSTIASLARICSVPLPPKRHKNTWSMSSLVLDPVSSCYTPPGSVKQAKRRPISGYFDAKSWSSSHVTQSQTAKRPENDMNRSTEQLRRTETEPCHTAGLQQQAESRQTGFWAKINRIALSKREQVSFNRLRRASGGPVSRADVLADSERFVFRAGETANQFDSGHKPLKLHQERVNDRARDEYWEEDPFNGNIYVVRWMANEPPLAANSVYRFSPRNESKCSLRSTHARDLEYPMHVNVDRISTIRIVEGTESGF